MPNLKFGAKVIIAIPTTSGARRSPTWIDALTGIQLPLASAAGKVWTVDLPIADARNELCKKALQYNPDYIVMIGDDVLAPNNTILTMLNKIGRRYDVLDEQGNSNLRADLITGIYWTKSVPTDPYIFNGALKGPYKDWKAGDFFPVDLAGCDCLMIDVNVLKTVPYPWFSTNWTWNEGDFRSLNTTEDFYFFAKARKHGFRLFADTGIQCFHEDRNNGNMYGMTYDMPQAGGIRELENLKDSGDLIAADLGAGMWSPQWPENIKIMRFDLRRETNPDVCCDIINIPEQFYGKFDIVHACHVLEHFPRRDAPDIVKHWLKLLKPGGTIIIKVPNIKHALDTIYKAIEKPGTIDREQQGYAWAQLYGDQQGYEHAFHRNGFIVEKLINLMKQLEQEGLLTDIKVEEILEENGQNLHATAKLVRSNEPEVLTRDYFSDFMVEKPEIDVDSIISNGDNITDAVKLTGDGIDKELIIKMG